MKKENKIIKAVRYFSLLLVIGLGLVSIIGTGGGSGGGGGGGGSGSSAIYPRFAYVANYTEDSVSYYAVENDTGRLRYQGKIDAGGGPWSLTVDPSGTYAYVVNYNSDTVSQYTIGTDGSLTAMTPANVLAGDSPYAVTVDPSGSSIIKPEPPRLSPMKNPVVFGGFGS